ncbi:bifunctional DNA-formamidopyrimidine glycosylase/DNA-(apurinic or apyrimidinic site) lyase [Marinospirillum sp.]|uniref:bifunctional DNA-formamidopyrimidine glycosylase/DNA-(apurinic or apyrimidinic site) lyase n=1 Tax=Marinospirillum sp. TaxID=2183934 RepID=UPI003A838FC1
MPELPEVETTRLGIAPWLEGRTILAFTLRQGRLRWPVDPELSQQLPGLIIQPLLRRSKYLIMPLAAESKTPEDASEGLIWHLGMSGSLRLVQAKTEWKKHDHLELVVQPHQPGDPDRLRYHDPRRFGALLHYQGAWQDQPALAHLGPEPLSAEFNAAWLYQATRAKRQAIKVWLMSPQRVVGVGNIYATEALFEARIDPRRAAGSLSESECARLVEQVKDILAKAITQGGTTLRDFVGGDGQPGYFAQTLQVYGRAGAPCRVCGTDLEQLVQAQRRTVFCPQCQR